MRAKMRAEVEQTVSRRHWIVSHWIALRPRHHTSNHQITIILTMSIIIIITIIIIVVIIIIFIVIVS